MTTFSESKDILSQWKGKQVRLEMMNGGVPRVAGPVGGLSEVVEGELVQVYDNAITVKINEAVEVLYFAQAMRGIRLLPSSAEA